MFHVAGTGWDIGMGVFPWDALTSVMLAGVSSRTYQPGLHFGMQTSIGADVSGVKVIVTESCAVAGLVMVTVYATDGTAAAPGKWVHAKQRNATTMREIV